jgi:proteasome assembly chaperone (PAC2) family protein
MANELKLNHPWLVAGWPGMGHVATSGCYYLLAKLGMHLIAELSPNGLFDLDHVSVADGLIKMGRLPRSRFFVWNDPRGKRDVIVFIGEAQPPMGKRAYCQQLIAFAKSVGVERVFTFAAMVTAAHPRDESQVFSAATERGGVEELKRLGLTLLNQGHISGLNGVLLGVAAEAGLQGTCLLGEVPHILAQVPCPRAALAVLKIFATMAEVELDFSGLLEQAELMDRELSQLLTRGEGRAQQAEDGEQEEKEDEDTSTAMPEKGTRPEDEQQIEELFRQAIEDRSKAYELKRELDRLNVFGEYENRFLDLFKKP